MRLSLARTEEGNGERRRGVSMKRKIVKRRKSSGTLDDIEYIRMIEQGKVVNVV